MLDRLTQWLAGSAAEDLIPRGIGFNAPLSLTTCLLLLGGVAVFAAWWYTRQLDGVTPARRTVLVALRVTFIVLVLFLALDPAVLAKYVRPGEQFVALLFDDSLSMRIADETGQHRGEQLQAGYAGARGVFEETLQRKHRIVRYRVGETAQPIRSVDELRFDQKQSDLTGGIGQVLRDLEGNTVSAVVLFSDGVQRAEESLATLDELPEDVPIYAVGIGDSAAWRDIELTSLNVQRTDFDRSPVILTVHTRSSGLAGREAVVEVTIGSRVVTSKRIDITESEESHEVELEFVPDRKDRIEYEARVTLTPAQGPDGAPAPPDHIGENNVRRFAVDNRQRTYRILYVSARPNWQNKFIRMALDADREELRLTSLIAISNAEQKFEFRGRKSTLSNPLFEGFENAEDRPRYDETVFLRLGAAKDELKSGFPVEAEELFAYDLVVLGDVERPFFKLEQLELLRDFVDRRGGSLLMLGGPASFTEGGYAGTVIEKMLPVVLFPKGSEASQVRVDGAFSVEPTIEGRLAGSWLFDEDEAADAELWAALPPLYGLSRFPLVRAGASVMSVAANVEGEPGSLPVFAVQRYGEGRCAIFAAGDTWQWQMRNEYTDDRHERFWRQVVRNLVSDVPEPAILRDKQDAYTQGQPCAFTFLLRNDAFERAEALQCVVTVVTPEGKTESLAVEESLEDVGAYTSPYTPQTPGLHELSLVASNGKGETVARVDEAFLVRPDYREFTRAQYNPGFLEALTASHGGGVFALDSLDRLAASIPVPEVRDAREVVLHLWRLPIFYIALVVLMITEWYLRRRAGQA